MAVLALRPGFVQARLGSTSQPHTPLLTSKGQIFVKGLSGRTSTVDGVCFTAMGVQLMRMIEDKLGEPVVRPPVCDGKLIQPYAPCRLYPGATVHLMPRLCGGMVNSSDDDDAPATAASSSRGAP